jgi:paraquat-inducible protein B
MSSELDVERKDVEDKISDVESMIAEVGKKIDESAEMLTLSDEELKKALIANVEKQFSNPESIRELRESMQKSIDSYRQLLEIGRGISGVKDVLTALDNIAKMTSDEPKPSKVEKKSQKRGKKQWNNPPSSF